MAPPLDLKDLRNLSKRDPSGYHAEFVLQYRHFQTQLQIFLLKPSEDYKPFSDLVEYLCHVSDIYSKDMPDFPEQISNLLEKNCDILASPLRRSLVSALILLRSKNQITPHNVLSLFFKLFRCKDAGLREMLYKHIVNDITNINKKHKNQNLNHALQNFMFTMMKDPNEMAAKQSLNVMIELYRKKVWNDPKTVNVISTGIFSGVTAVVVSTLKFFLTVAADDEEDRISEHKEQAKLTIKKMNLKLNVKKMSHSARDRAQKAIVDANESKTIQRKLDPNWPAIELINDPQGYAEKVFGVARHSFERAEVRLMLMNFISRLIFTHKLIILNFYPFVQRYLMPKNEHVTYALSILAQSVHELIPPTDLQPLVKHLVDKFVHDRSANESIVAGLHTLREMANRNPLIMNEGLVRDLSMYKNYKDKAVTTAARGLIGVYRVHNPALLEKRDRGKEGSMNKEKPLEYGEVRASSGVSDIELLQRIKMIEQQEKLNKSKRIASEVDLEGNIIAYESEEEDDDEEDGEGDDDEDGEDDEGEDGEGELMEVSDEEADSDESDESEVEEVTFTKKMKKGSAKKGGVVPTEGVMSIAEALKLEKMQREAIELQRAKQLSRRDKRKRGEQYEDEEEEDEDDEDEDDEDEDEDEDDDEEDEDEEKAEPEPIAEPEIDIFAQIEMAADDSVTVINHPKPKKVEKVIPMVYQPPMKKLRTEEEEVDSEDSEDDEEMEEVQVAKQTNKKKPVKSVPVEADEAEPKLDLQQPIDLNTILTEEDFVRLAKLREMKADGKISLARLRNLSRDLEEQEEDSDEEDSNGVVDPSSLLRGIKNRKDKEELLKESEEKRANREKRTKIKLKRTTNEEKTKFKNLMMIMKGKKTYAKGMRSFSERQVAMQKGKVKFSKRKHK